MFHIHCYPPRHSNFCLYKCHVTSTIQGNTEMHIKITKHRYLLNHYDMEWALGWQSCLLLLTAQRCCPSGGPTANGPDIWTVRQYDQSQRIFVIVLSVCHDPYLSIYSSDSGADHIIEIKSRHQSGQSWKVALKFYNHFVKIIKNVWHLIDIP